MNQMDNTVKTLAYLVIAAILIFVGLIIILGIIKVAFGILNFFLPIILIAAAGYFIYQWWNSRAAN